MLLFQLLNSHNFSEEPIFRDFVGKTREKRAKKYRQKTVFGIFVGIL